MQSPLPDTVVCPGAGRTTNASLKNPDNPASCLGYETQMIPAPSQTPASINVLVVGNSNSIAVTSYANLLADMPDIKLHNSSIGGVPNIVLLSVIADDQIKLSNFDFIIIEPAIIEGQLLYPGSPYTKEQSEQTFDLFMTCLRARSSAKVILLILPTLSGLIDPRRNLAEQHYKDLAAKHDIAVINSYSIIRQLGLRGDNTPPADLVRNVEELVTSFRLPPSNRDLFVWRLWMRQPAGALHRASIGTIPFAEHAFEDPIHVSRAFHDLLAKLIYEWIMKDENLGQRSGLPEPQCDLVVRSMPHRSGPAAEPIYRQSKLISRLVVPLDTEQVCTYPCPRGYRAAAILLNESMTSGFLTIESPQGRSAINICPPARGLQWNASLVAILDDIGDGDITVRVSTSAPDWVPAPKPHYLVPSGSALRGTAELGEMLLIKRDWQESATSSYRSAHASSAATESIEASHWARRLMTEHAITCSKAQDGIRRSNILIKRGLFNAIASRASSAADAADWLETQACLLVAAEEFDAARSLLKSAVNSFPDHKQFAKMTLALNLIPN